MKMTMKLLALDFDKVEFTRELDLAIKAEMKMATRAFLNVAVRAIPVRTGFARGALQNLAAAAGMQGSVDESAGHIFLNSIHALRRLSFNKPEFYRGSGSKILKSPGTGQQFGTQPGEVFKVEGAVYTMNFQSMIDYFNINDLFVNWRNPGTPWNAFKYGRMTFFNYLQTTGLQRLPQIGQYIKKVQLTSG